MNSHLNIMFKIQQILMKLVTSKDVAYLFLSYGKSPVTSLSSKNCCMLIVLSNTYQSFHEPSFHLSTPSTALERAQKISFFTEIVVAGVWRLLWYHPHSSTKIKRIVLTATLRSKRSVLAVCVTFVDVPQVRILQFSWFSFWGTTVSF